MQIIETGRPMFIVHSNYELGNSYWVRSSLEEAITLYFQLWDDEMGSEDFDDVREEYERLKAARDVANAESLLVSHQADIGKEFWDTITIIQCPLNADQGYALFDEIPQ